MNTLPPIEVALPLVVAFLAILAATLPEAVLLPLLVVELVILAVLVGGLVYLWCTGP